MKKEVRSESVLSHVFPFSSFAVAIHCANCEVGKTTTVQNAKKSERRSAETHDFPPNRRRKGGTSFALTFPKFRQGAGARKDGSQATLLDFSEQEAVYNSPLNT